MSHLTTIVNGGILNGNHHPRRKPLHRISLAFLGFELYVYAYKKIAWKVTFDESSYGWVTFGAAR